MPDLKGPEKHPDKKPVNNVLTSPTLTIANAYNEALLALLGRMEEISDSLAELSGCANVVASYLERKGLEEKIFSPEDIENLRSNDDGEPDDEEPSVQF